MRKWLGVIAAVGALAWSGAAYAVVDVDSVPTTAAGAAGATTGCSIST